MIVVKVELWSAITGEHSTLALMTICNEGGSQTRGDYSAATYKGRDEAALAASMRAFFLDKRLGATTRRGEVKNHARLSEHVWNLVAKALGSMNYGSKGGAR